MQKPSQNRVRRLAELARATYAAFNNDDGRALSAALVYYSTLSFVPLVIMIFAVPGLFLRFVDREAGDQLVSLVDKLFGAILGAVISNALERVQSQSLAVTGVSLGMLLFSSSSAFRFLRYAFRRIWREEERLVDESHFARMRKTVLVRALDYLIAFGIVFAAPVVVMAGLLALALSLFARVLLLDVPLFGDALGSLITPLVLFGIYVGVFIFLLWALPPVRLRWSEIWFPGLLCGVAVLITTYSLSLYLQLFGASSLYGAIGILFALQIWMYANAIVLFSSAELCKLLVRGHVSAEAVGAPEGRAGTPTTGTP